MRRVGLPSMAAPHPPAVTLDCHDWWVAVTSTGASLRIRTNDGTAQRVTDLLGIEPSRSFEIGDVLGTLHPHTAAHAMWRLDTPIDEHPLEFHLSDLCDQLGPAAVLLHELIDEGYLMDWFCFVESGLQGSVELDHAMLQRLAAFPVGLTLDLYPDGDEDNQQ
jgi:hypothetical protein